MRVLDEQPCGVLACQGRVLLVAWSSAPLEEPMVASILASVRREAVLQKKVVCFVILRHNSPMPSDPVRKLIQEEMRQLDPYFVCGATVIDRAGFRGSALRAVVSTMQLLSRPKHPERVFATAEEATTFVRAELERAGLEAPSHAEVLAACSDASERAEALGVETKTTRP